MNHVEDKQKQRENLCNMSLNQIKLNQLHFCQVKNVI